MVAVASAVATVMIGASAPTTVKASSEADAASRPPLNLPIFITSRNDDCYDGGEVTAIKRLTTEAANRINGTGGIAGRQLLLNFLDDQRDQQKAVNNMLAALNDPQTFAMIGMSNPNRAKAAFDTVGKDLKASGIPFVSDIGLASIIADYPNVFTTRPSEDEERLPVMVEFIKQMKITKPAFVGLQSSLASTSLGDALKKNLGEQGLAADYRLRLVNDKLDPAEITAMVADLKAQNVDLIFLSIGGNRTKDLLGALQDAQLTPPLFVSGRIENMVAKGDKPYPNDIYQLAWNGLPDVYNDRLRKLVSDSPTPNNRIFEGRKNADAAGWKDGKCKPRDDDFPLKVLDDDNMRALAVGTQYADIVSLIAEAGRTADVATELPDLRAIIAHQIEKVYASGRGTFRGRFNNWSFQPSSHAAARTPLVVMLPRGLGRTQLAPIQFVHLRDKGMRRIDTLYADIDLIHAERIDDNDKTFFADFYLSLNDRAGGSIDQIEFSNAYLEPGSNDRQITVRVVHDGGKSDAFPII